MLKKIHIWLTAALTATLLLAACSDDDMLRETPTENEDEGLAGGDVYIRFHMTLNNGGSRSGGSRAQHLIETPATSREDAISSIDLLIHDAATGTLIDVISLVEEQIRQITTDGVTVPIAAKKGQELRIYAAANIPDRMRSQLIVGQSSQAINDISLQSYFPDYWDVMDELIPGCAGLQENLQASDHATIPMTGQFVTREPNQGNEKIKITDGHGTSFDKPIDVRADVSRIVAKVHVLAKTPELTGVTTDIKYVFAEDKSAGESADPTNPFSNYIGWIRLDSIRYMPNGIANSTYLFPHFDSKKAPFDLDRDLDKYIYGNRFNRNLWSKNYIYYNGQDLHKENISPSCHLTKVEEYDLARYTATENGSDDDTRYTRGMYCPENYFNSPANDNVFKNYDNSIPMITHVSIAAKLTPRNIVFRKSFADLMNEFVRKYRDKPDDFRKEYSLTVDDFTDEDAERWEKVIKVRYFSKFETPTAAKTDSGTADSPDAEATEPAVTPVEPAVENYRKDYCIIRTLSERDAADILNWSLMATNLWSHDPSDFEQGRYPAGTFFVYDTNYDTPEQHDNQWKQRYLYMASGAVTTASGDHEKLKTYSVPHLNGWGYYYTYLDETGATGTTGKTPYQASQVTRNHYYLITVNNFGVPGGTITRPEYIKVNTESVDWVYKGKGDIILH